MNIKTVTDEISSPALKQIVAYLWDTVDSVRAGKISHQQATVEITGQKHIIQSIALDWLYNNYKNKFQTSIAKKEVGV